MNEMSDEGLLHEAAMRFEGEWEIPTDFGSLRVSLIPERIGYGSKRGVPDEVIHVEVRINFWGRDITLRAPILLEAETKGGLQGALDDLVKYEERSLGREKLNPDITIPMVVIGTGFHRQRRDIRLAVTAEIVEVTTDAVPQFHGNH